MFQNRFFFRPSFFFVALFFGVILNSFAQVDNEELTKHRVTARKRWLPNGLGLKLGGPIISYKRYFYKSAYEINAGALTGGKLGFIPRFQFQVFYQTDIALVEGLQWYVCTGIHYYKAVSNRYSEIGPNFLGGIEYKFKDLPLSVCLDAGPNFGYDTYYEPGWHYRVQVGFGIRYRL